VGERGGGRCLLGVLCAVIGSHRILPGQRRGRGHPLATHGRRRRLSAKVHRDRRRTPPRFAFHPSTHGRRVQQRS
jgi:hypothetical protein